MIILWLQWYLSRNVAYFGGPLRPHAVFDMQDLDTVSEDADAVGLQNTHRTWSSLQSAQLSKKVKCGFCSGGLLSRVSRERLGCSWRWWSRAVLVMGDISPLARGNLGLCWRLDYCIESSGPVDRSMSSYWDIGDASESLSITIV